MTPLLQWTLAAGCTTVALGWFAVMPPWRATPDEAATERPATSQAAPTPPVQQPSAATPSAASLAAPAQPGQTEALRKSTQAALASDNAGDRIAALRAVRDRHAVELLPDLLALDPARDPELAPTLISVSADLANLTQATPAQRTAAASQLATWLQTESQRAATDARGNQSVLIEALGRLNTPQSVAALSRSLEADTLPVHVATLAAEGLARLGDPSARPAVERFRARLEAQPAADGLSQELRSEALATADRALANWR